MELALIVYFAGVVTDLKIGTLILFCLGVAGIIVYTAYHQVDAPKNTVYKKWPAITVASIFLFHVILPSERTMWLMAGAYGTQSVIESQVGQDMKKLIELKIKGLVEEELKKAQK